MASPQLQKSLRSAPLVALPKSLIPGQGSPAISVRPASSSSPFSHQKVKGRRACAVPNKVQAVVGTRQKSVASKAVITVKPTIGGLLTNIGFTRGLDDITDLLGKSLYLELVSAELDPKTGQQKETIGAYARSISHSKDEIKYEANFKINDGFGEVGAILVTNEHHREMFFSTIVLTGIASEPITIECNSWVHAKSESPEKRIFFANKVSISLIFLLFCLITTHLGEFALCHRFDAFEGKIFVRAFDFSSESFWMDHSILWNITGSSAWIATP